MKNPISKILLSVVACMFNTAKAQVYNTGGLFIASAGTVYINDSFYHASSAVYQNDGTLTLEGNFINNSTSLSGTGTTAFNNSSTQQIEGTQTSVFGTGIIQSTSNVLLKQNATFTGSLTINSGNTANINGNTLTVSNGFSGTGKLKGSASSNLVAGGNGTIYFNHADYYLHDMTINSGATLALGDSLNIVAGTAFGTVIANGALTSAGYLTMKSNSLGTARVGISADSVRGYATVERYIPPRRSWRAINLPFKYSPQTIREAWQEGVNNTDLNYANNKNPKPGFGMHISGNNNTSLGFDLNTTYNASILTWDQPTNDWTYTAPPTISTNISSYEGYFTFVRGSRAVNLSLATSAPTDSTILRARGVMNFGAISKTYTANINDQVLIANPYPSSINIATLISNTTRFTKNKFWVWDPKLSDGYGTGAYVTYSNGVMIPNTGSYPTPTTIIQEQQSFWMEAAVSNPSVSFVENYKSASQTNIFGFTGGEVVMRASKPDPKTYINLMLATDIGPVLMDGVAEVYDNIYSAGVDWDDATKLNNFYENIALRRDGKALAIETRPYPQVTDTMFVDLWGLKQRQYYIQTLPEAIPTAVKEAWLIDNYFKTETQLSLTEETLYSFIPNGDPASYTNRFLIVFAVERGQKANGKSSSVSIADAGGSRLSIFPNPVTSGRAVLNLVNQPKADYSIIIFNTTGKKLSELSISHPGGTSVNYPLDISNTWPAGLYNVIVTNKETGKSSTLSLLVNK